MQKTIFLLFIFHFSDSLFAQRSFNPGITLGLNTSQVSGDDLAGFNQFGLYGGVNMNISFLEDQKEKYAVNFQMAFSQKGSRKPVDPNGNNSVYVIRLNYIDIPIMISRRFKRNIFAELGITNSYLINWKERNQYGSLIPVRPFFNYELSALAGVGYWLAHGTTFSIRYSNSVLPIRHHQSNATYILNRGQYNSVVLFSFTYSLRNKKR